MNTSFPSEWPPDCPPADSHSASGLAYRIVKNDPVRDEDFRSQYELGLAQNADLCLRHALSVFGKASDAAHRRKLTPKLGRFIAEGLLSPDHGNIKHTGGRKSTHMEWWPVDGIDRKAVFAVKQGF
jgi:hypothetical protein